MVVVDSCGVVVIVTFRGFVRFCVIVSGECSVRVVLGTSPNGGVPLVSGVLVVVVVEVVPGCGRKVS